MPQESWIKAVHLCVLLNTNRTWISAGEGGGKKVAKRSSPWIFIFKKKLVQEMQGKSLYRILCSADRGEKKGRRFVSKTFSRNCGTEKKKKERKEKKTKIKLSYVHFVTFELCMGKCNLRLPIQSTGFRCYQFLKFRFTLNRVSSW